MKSFVGLLCLGTAILVFSSCASAPPVGAIPNRIVVVADTNSPYWKSKIYNPFSAWLNGVAGYKVAFYWVEAARQQEELAAKTSNHFRLVVQLLGEEKNIVGYSSPHVLAGTQVNYKRKVEIRATFLDPAGRKIGTWEEWAENANDDTSVTDIAIKIAKKMRDAGVLAAGFLNPPASSPANPAAPPALDKSALIAALRQGAAQGDAGAQNALGKHYYAGDGVLQDFSEARTWWDKAAAQGNTAALFNLGLLYEAGAGVTKDIVQAYALYNLAASRGFTPAVERRAECIKKMSPEQVTDGQQRSRERASLLPTP